MARIECRIEHGRLQGLLFSLAALLASAPMCVAQSAAPVSLLQQPATPAVLALSGGQLTIRAKNSSLRAILDSLASMTGVKIDGFSHDERIFGVYGPGDPQKILAGLLASSGYNVIVAGRKPDGAPREIVLSLPSSLPVEPSQPASQRNDGDAQQGYSGYPPTPAPAQEMPPPRGHPGTEKPRTAQEMLQELERMRQQANPENTAQQQ